MGFGIPLLWSKIGGRYAAIFTFDLHLAQPFSTIPAFELDICITPSAISFGDKELPCTIYNKQQPSQEEHDNGCYSINVSHACTCWSIKE